jgi:hypothetical protein
MVGAVRIELTTSCTRNTRATRLRYAPNRIASLPAIAPECNVDFHHCGWSSHWTGMRGCLDRFNRLGSEKSSEFRVYAVPLL